VRWIDSSLQNGQVDRHDFPKPEVITSVGFVVDETDEYVTLARDDMGHDGDYRGLVSIPKIAVLP
jgi:predicted DNA-binding transcriptional regulator AlpA